MVPETNIKKTDNHLFVAIYWLMLIVFLAINSIATASTINGRVTDIATKKPLSGVEIHLVHEGKILAITDSEGNFKLDNLEGNQVTLLFIADNYKQKVITINLNETPKSITIELEKLQFELKEVKISGKFNPRSDENKNAIEKEATAYIDIVSGKFAEHNGSESAADVIQSVPGLSVKRGNTGNGEKAIIRGMEPKYSYTLINGFKIPSPDDKSRYVSLDIFPAGLLQSVQVIKSLTANMEGDAIAGATNLVMRQPPNNFVLEAGINSGYNNQFINSNYLTFNDKVIQDQSPYQRFGSNYYATATDFTKDNLSFHNSKALPDLSANFLLGDNFLKGKLASITAADYKNLKSGSTGYFIPLNAQPNLNNVPAFSDFYTQTYYNNKIALSFYQALTFKPNEQNNFNFTYLFLNQRDIETRSQIDTSLVLGRSGAGTGRIYLGDRSRLHEQGLNNFTFKGSHLFGNIKLNWAGIYSAANGAFPDWAELTANTGKLLAPDGSITQTPLLLAPLSRSWLSNKENDEDIFIDFEYSPSFLKKKNLTFYAGSLLRLKTRDNFYNNYVFNPQINESFTNIYNAIWVNNNGPQNPLGNVDNANTYHATEKINAYYFMEVLHIGRSEFTSGIRYEGTNQNFVSRIDPNISYGNTVNIRFNDWLPDFHWKYIINEGKQLRASYFKAISRPALYDITFSKIAYEDYNVAGNPFLQRTLANNFDISYSWFSNNKSSLRIGTFYKQIINAFEKTLINGNDELYPLPENGLSYTPAGVLTEQLKNTGTATNYGIEFNYSFYWNNFNVGINYTFTSSEISRMKKYITRQILIDPSSNEITITKLQTGPLEGQSKNLLNFNLLYQNPTRHWFGNLSMVYNSKRIDLVSPWYGLDYWQKQNLTLNLTAGKNLTKNLKVTASALNLFNNGLSDFIAASNPNGNLNNYLPGQSNPSIISVLKQDFSAHYILGVQYYLNK